VSPADVVLTVVSMTLAVAASVCAWDARRQAQRADAAHQRARAAYAERKEFQDRDADAVKVIHEWQRDGESNDYMTRVYLALRPSVSGDSQKLRGTE
jgi:type VI protein secretion system component VasK